MLLPKLKAKPVRTASGVSFIIDLAVAFFTFRHIKLSMKIKLKWLLIVCFCFCFFFL